MDILWLMKELKIIKNSAVLLAILLMIKYTEINKTLKSQARKGKNLGRS